MLAQSFVNKISENSFLSDQIYFSSNSEVVLEIKESDDYNSDIL